jgi:hypothetical protein
MFGVGRRAGQRFYPLVGEGETAAAFAMMSEPFGIERLPAESLYNVLQVIDWPSRKQGMRRELCERGLLPTTHRLLIVNAAAVTAIPYGEIEHLRAYQFFAKGFIKFTAGGQRYTFSTHRDAAPGFVWFMRRRMKGRK